VLLGPLFGFSLIGCFFGLAGRHEREEHVTRAGGATCDIEYRDM